MRKVAAIGFATSAPDTGSAALLFDQIDRSIAEWIGTKRALHETEPKSGPVTLRDGRVGEISRKADSIDVGKLLRVTFREPIAEHGTFETRIFVGVRDRVVGFACSLRVGVPIPGMALRFEVHPPALVRKVIALDSNWSVSETPITDRAFDFRGASGGDDLEKVLWHPGRTVPVAVVSEYEGVALSPNLHEDIARELAGFALVVKADAETCWRLTELRGKAWSVYNGAIRLYFPMGPAPQQGDSFSHPLWTPWSLFSNEPDLLGRIRRLRQLLRRRALAVSALSTYFPEPLGSLLSLIDGAPIVPPRHDAVGVDWQALAEEYAQDSDRLREEIKERLAEVMDLRTQVQNLQVAIKWQSPAAEPEEVEPETETPPSSVSDAVQQARREGELVFGGDVETGVENVAPDSGPPEKILSYLRTLAALSKALRDGPLGQDRVRWLRERGVTCSGESETTRNSRNERQMRTWDNGHGQSQYFDLHLKPSDAIAPDRCVRIYCEYDAERGRIVVGWVGRKPGL